MELGIRRDCDEDRLRDAAHDAFMAFWQGADTADSEALWLRYCVAQERYEQRLREAVQTGAIDLCVSRGGRRVLQ
jgi:hypothetical protein